MSGGLEVGRVYTSLGARLDDTGYEAFDARLSKARENARRGATAELDAAVNGRAFDDYGARLSRAERATQAAHARMAQSSRALEKVELDVRAATLGVEDAQVRAAAAHKKAGEGSLEHRKALLEVERAQHRVRDSSSSLSKAVREVERDGAALTGGLGLLGRAASSAGGGLGGGGLAGGAFQAVAGMSPLLPLALAAAPALLAVGGAALAMAGSLAQAGAGAGAVAVGIAAAAGPLAAVGGAVALRVSKLQDAYKALGTVQEKGGAQAAASAKAQASAAQAVKSAQENLDDARRNGAESVASAERALEDARRNGIAAVKSAELSLAEARKTNAAAVAGAEKALGDARHQAETDVAQAERDLANTRRAGADSVRQAEQALAQTRTQGAADVRSALRALTDTQRDARIAQDDLTAAHARERRELADLASASRHAALAQEGADLALEGALERLGEVQADPKSTLRDIKEAQYAVKVARQGVEDAKTTRKRADEDAAAGTTTVADARENLREANTRVAQAEIDLGRARTASEKSVRDAVKAVADARRKADQDNVRAEARAGEVARSSKEAQAQAARDLATAIATADDAIAKSEGSLAKARADEARATTRAQEAVGKAAADAARSTKRAAEGVAAASAAQSAALDSQGASADAAQAKLDSLTKTERGLLTTFRGFAGAFTKAFEPATDAIFGGVDGALKRVEPLLDHFAGGFTKIGGRVGDVITHAADALAGPAWTKALDDFVDTAEEVVEPVGNAIGSALDIFRNIAVAAQPYVIELAHWIEDALSGLEGKTSDGEGLSRTIGHLIDQTKSWVHFVGAVSRLVFDLFNGGADAGRSLVDRLTDVANRWADFLETKEGQEKLRKFFKDAVARTGELLKVVSMLANTFFKLSDIFVRNRVVFALFLGMMAGAAVALAGPEIAIAALVLGLVALYTNSKIVRDVVGTVFRVVAKIVGQEVDFILGYITGLLGGLSSMLSFAGKLPGKFGAPFREAAKGIDAARDAVDKLREGIRRATDPMDEYAKGAERMREKTYKSLSSLRKDTETQMALIKKTTKSGSVQSREALASNFSSAAAAVRRAMKAGTISTKEGLAEIRKLMAKALAQYGITGAAAQRYLNSSVGDTAGKGDDTTATGKDGDTYTSSPGRARGGRTKRESGGWLGGRGLVGMDTIPIDGGFIAAPGEYHARGRNGGAIINRHQAPIVEDALAAGGHPGLDHGAGLSAIEAAMAPLGGLDRLFSAIQRPHYLAGGGYTRVGASTFGGHNDPSAFGHKTASGAIANDTLVGYAELSKNPAALDFSALGHLPMGTRLRIRHGGKSIVAPKVDVGAGGGAVDGHPRAIDLTYAVGQALGINGLGLVDVERAGGAAISAAGGRATADTIRKILAPKIKQGGTIGAVAQGVVNRVTSAANARLKSAAASARPAADAGVALFRGKVPDGITMFEGVPLARWIANEVRYARSHGWKGRISSGWRDPRRVITPSPGRPVAPQGQSEHGKTDYPHGAFDIGGSDAEALAQEAAFLRATAGYKGPKVVPLGGSMATAARDPGHMSGTGRMAGGRTFGQRNPTHGSHKPLGNAGIARSVARQERGLPSYETDIQSLEKRYSTASRRADLDGNDFLVENPDGSIVVDERARKDRADELSGLMTIRRAVRAKIRAYRDALTRAITTYKQGIAGLKKAIKAAKGKKRAKDRKRYRDELAGYQARVRELSGTKIDIGLDLEDSGVDIDELQQEIDASSSVGAAAATQGPTEAPASAEPADTASADAPPADDSAPAADPEPVTAPPSAEDLAAGIAAAFATFQQGRADLFGSFGANFMKPSLAAGFGGEAGQAAGTRYFGGASGGNDGGGAVPAAGGIVQNITFSGPQPADPHTFTQAALHELEAAV